MKDTCSKGSIAASARAAFYGFLAGLFLLALGHQVIRLKNTAEIAQNGAGITEAFAPAIQRALPAIVGVTAIRPPQERASGPILVRMQTRIDPPGDVGRGSGVLVGPEGPLLTSRRLIEGASAFMITLSDGRHYRAHLIGSDPITDIAVLRVDAEDLPFLKFGKSKISVGDPTMAIGSTVYGDNAMSPGTITAVGNREDDFGFIETRNGMSQDTYGGALINERGELVGIQTMPLSAGNQRPALAVPARLAFKVMRQIVMKGVAKEKLPLHLSNSLYPVI